MKQLRKFGTVILAAALAFGLSIAPAQAAVKERPDARRQEIKLSGAGEKLPALKDQSMELRVGDSKKIGLKNCGGLKVTYKSDYKAIATVSKKGIVKAKKEGRTYIYITVKTKKGEMRGRWSCRIDVKPALASTKTVEGTIRPDKQLQLKITSTEKDAEMEITISTESQDPDLKLSIGIPKNPNNYAEKVLVVDRITPDKKQVTVKTSNKVIIWNDSDTSVDVTIKVKAVNGKKIISDAKAAVL